MRKHWIDYCKALGIFLVVFGHVHRGLEKSGLVTDNVFFLFSDSIIYSFHMPLFFFLSGLLFFKSTKSDNELIASKIDTIAYPYFLWSILQGVAEFLLSEHTNHNTSSHDFLYNLLVSPQNQFWFLYALFFCFLTAIFIFKIVQKKYSIWIFLISIIVFLSFQYFPEIFILKIISRYFVFFMLGYMLSSYILGNKEFLDYISNTSILILLVCVALIFQYYFHFTLRYTFISNNIYSIGLSFIMIITTVSFCIWLSKRLQWNILIHIGASSMAIFLMHIFATSGVRIFLKEILNIDSYLLHLTLGTLSGVLFPLIAIKLLEKIGAKYYFQAPVSKWIIKY